MTFVTKDLLIPTVKTIFTTSWHRWKLYGMREKSLSLLPTKTLPFSVI